MKTIEVQKLDVTKYVGTEKDIVSADVIKSQYGAVIKVQTEPIDLKDGDTLSDGKYLTASIMLGLIEKDGKLYIGKDSKTETFLKAKKIDIIKNIPDNVEVGDSIKALLGIKVVVQKNQKGFLEIG